MGRTLILGSCLFLLSTSHSWAQFNVENPTTNTTQSGISVVSGWICNASKIEVVIDNFGGVPIPHGIARPDAQTACAGKLNTGFGLLVNWNNLSPGSHQVIAHADGVEFGRATVTVATFGTDFLRGASGTYTIPFNGRNVTLQWQESLQNFVINGVQ